MTRWIILRTSGAHTLPLMRSLCGAGFAAWTPVRSVRKVVRRGKRATQRIEIDVPILPTFLFAREGELTGLAAVAAQAESPHPAFSIFRHGGWTPIVHDREIKGLREEEQRSIETMQAMRAAETHDEAERIRIAAIKSQAARHRAMREMERARLVDLRSQRQALEPGAEVRVSEHPAFVGVTGVVESSDGAFAMVRFGERSFKVEGWRLLASDSVPLAA